MVTKILAAMVVAFVAAQILVRAVKKICRIPAPAAFGRLFDSRPRHRYQPPERILQRSGLGEGMYVLDLGCGSGALATVAARKVGPTGRVAAFDLQAGMLRQLREKLGRPDHTDIGNVLPVVGDAHDLPFRDRAFDLVYMAQVLQEIPDRDRALQEVKRVLRPGGAAGVTEILPDPDYAFPSTTIRLGENATLECEAVEGNLWEYTIRFRRTAP